MTVPIARVEGFAVARLVFGTDIVCPRCRGRGKVPDYVRERGPLNLQGQQRGWWRTIRCPECCGAMVLHTLRDGRLIPFQP